MTKIVVIRLRNGKIVEINSASGDAKIVENAKRRSRSYSLKAPSADSLTRKMLSVRIKPNFKMIEELDAVRNRTESKDAKELSYSIAGAVVANAELLNSKNFLESLKRDPSDKEMDFYRKISLGR